MENKVTSYQSLVMERVDNFYQLSRDRNIISAILTIESIEVLDAIDEVVLLRVSASILTIDIALTFSQLVEKDNLSKFRVGQAWNIAGTYLIDWDNKCIELYPQAEELLSTNNCWASQYARDNKLAVRQHLACDNNINFNHI